MPILSKEECMSLLKKVLSYSKADECEINLNGTDTNNIRYARNSVSTSGGVSSTTILVQSAFGKKVGTATVNEYDDASLEKVVRRAEELARLAPENPEYMPCLPQQTYGPSNTFVVGTGAVPPSKRAELVGQSLQVAKDTNTVVAGYLEDITSFAAMLNSKGLFAYNTSTNVNFSVTARTEDGKGSGYAIKGYNDITKLDTKTATQIAADKGKKSATARAIEPGKYTVILEPAAAAVLLENLIFGLDARQADEGRSFMSLPGGKTRLGEKLMDERVNIYSDPQNVDLPTSPWTGDGRAQEKVSWIEKGVVKNLAYNSRFWADKKGVKAIPGPDALIMEGGTKSIEELIKSTKKGILVTKLWYIRPVDPQTLLLTGLTRDGTFYIENGEVKYPIKNFRFNESPVIMLNNLEELGKVERTVSTESNNNYLIPPMKIRDFTFTSLSDAV